MKLSWVGRDTLPEGPYHPHRIFNLERHLVDRQTFRQRRSAALDAWRDVAA